MKPSPPQVRLGLLWQPGSTEIVVNCFTVADWQVGMIREVSGSYLSNRLPVVEVVPDGDWSFIVRLARPLTSARVFRAEAKRLVKELNRFGHNLFLTEDVWCLMDAEGERSREYQVRRRLWWRA